MCSPELAVRLSGQRMQQTGGPVWRHSLLHAGGIVVTFVGHPFDTVKVRLQTQDSAKPIYCEAHCLSPAMCAHPANDDICDGHAAGAIDCAKKTVQWVGLKGLYKVGLAVQAIVNRFTVGKILLYKHNQP